MALQAMVTLAKSLDSNNEITRIVCGLDNNHIIEQVERLENDLGLLALNIELEEYND